MSEPLVEAPTRRSRPWLVPVVLGIVLLVVGLIGSGRSPVGPRTIAIERVTLEPNMVRLHLRNDGPDLRVEQVLVNRAFWRFTLSEPSIGSGDRGLLTIAYPWDAARPLRIEMMHASGRTTSLNLSTAGAPSRETAPSGRSYLLLAMTLLAVPAAVLVLRLVSGRLRGATTSPVLAGLSLTGAAVLTAVTAAAGLGVSWLQVSPSLSGSGLLRIVEIIGAGFVISAALAWWAVKDGPERVDWAMPPAAYLVAVGVGVSNLAAGVVLRHQLAIGTLQVGPRLLVGLAVFWAGQSVVAAAALGPRPGGYPGAIARISALVAGPVIVGLVVGPVLAALAPVAFLAGWAAGILVVSLWVLGRNSQVALVGAPSLFAFGGLLGAGIVAIGLVAR